ncbi:MAG: ABC transporter substrate-binding protein [Alphaproteobacteria bacterium]|nr:ABC transporter substrate-binding protein [Alphaproteobacteria bacterium]
MSRWTAIAALVAAMVIANAAQAADKLVLQLHGPAQFEFAGYYAALWQGYYRDAGLTVEIKPGAGRGQPAIDPVREITEGRAQFATGTGELVVRAAQGLPLMLLAPIFQASGAAVYFRADSDFASPGSLTKARVGRQPSGDTLDIELTTALRAEGVDPTKLKSVPLEPTQIVPALADKTVDAAAGSAWDVPFLARDKGLALKSFNPADYRVEFYGDTLYTLRRLANTDPDTVAKFRTASLKGWAYALQHPDEVITRMVAELPAPAGISDAAALDRYQAEVARRLSRFPDVTLGQSNPDRWDRIEQTMMAAGAVMRTADTEDFVFDPDAQARSKTDLRAFILIGATVTFALAVTLWLVMRWRRGARPATRRRADPAPASPLPATPAPEAAAVSATPATASSDLNAVIGRLERAIRQRLPRPVSFRVSLLPELWPCRVDPGLLRSVLLDLVGAAASDMKNKGELIVGTRNYAFDAAALVEMPDARLGEYVRITVRDNGPGFAEDALARILDPAVSKRAAAASAAEVLRGAGGFVRVESAEGVGTAVHLYLPRIKEVAATGAASRPPKPAAAVA